MSIVCKSKLSKSKIILIYFLLDSWIYILRLPGYQNIQWKHVVHLKIDYIKINHLHWEFLWCLEKISGFNCQHCPLVVGSVSVVLWLNVVVLWLNVAVCGLTSLCCELMFAFLIALCCALLGHHKYHTVRKQRMLFCVILSKMTPGWRGRDKL